MLQARLARRLNIAVTADSACPPSIAATDAETVTMAATKSSVTVREKNGCVTNLFLCFRLPLN